MFLSLGLSFLLNYVTANSTSTKTTQIYFNHDASELMILNDTSNFTTNNNTHGKAYTSDSSSSNSQLSVGSIIVIVIGTMVGFIMVCCCCIFCMKGCLST
jgi:hypothetical protein